MYNIKKISFPLQTSEGTVRAPIGGMDRISTSGPFAPPVPMPPFQYKSAVRANTCGASRRWHQSDRSREPYERSRPHRCSRTLRASSEDATIPLLAPAQEKFTDSAILLRKILIRKIQKFEIFHARRLTVLYSKRTRRPMRELAPAHRRQRSSEHSDVSANRHTR